MGKQAAGAANTTLYLIEDQQNPARIAQLSEICEVAVGKRPNTALALHRLDHNSCGFIGNCSADLIKIKPVQMDKAR